MVPGISYGLAKRRATTHLEQAMEKNGGARVTPLGTAAKRPSPALEIIGFQPRGRMELPLYLATVAAGCPSPADDFIDRSLDLNEHLVEHPAATFFVRVYGDSMRDAGIHSGDILVVDRALEPANNKVVIAALDGELTVKRIRKRGGALWLLPDNPEFAPIRVGEEASFEIWGVVTYVIHKV
jgi:DNA polymerase V